jgi:hypothetical protein
VNLQQLRDATALVEGDDLTGEGSSRDTSDPPANVTALGLIADAESD